MHGVKNDPGLIPTERELKLTMKTIEKKNPDEELKLSNSVRTKLKPKARKPRNQENLVPKTKSSESDGAGLDQVKKDPSEEDKISDSCNEDEKEEEEEEEETESISIMKYNPHVCPFCDKSFKQLPQLGAHIMSAHEPPSDPDPQITMKNKKK